MVVIILLVIAGLVVFMVTDKKEEKKDPEVVEKTDAQKFAEEYKNGKVYICVAHTMPDLNSKELQDFIADVKQAFADAPFYSFDPLPLFVTCHTGPGALAAGFVVERTGSLKN